MSFWLFLEMNKGPLDVIQIIWAKKSASTLSQFFDNLKMLL